MKHPIFLIFFLVFAHLSINGQQSIVKNFDGVEKIDIDIPSGSLIVQKSVTGQVEVNVKYNEEELAPVLKMNGTGLKLEENHRPKEEGEGYNSPSRWTIKVPDHLSLRVNIGTGSASYRNLDFDLDHSSGVCKVDLEKVKGDLLISNGIGNIALKNGQGHFNFNSGTGDIIIRNSNGGFDLNSGTGHVEVSGSIVSLTSNLNSGTGNVSVQLAGDLAADLKINSGTGNSILDFNGLAMHGDFNMKCAKKGGKIIAPFRFENQSLTAGYEPKDQILIKKAQVGNGKHSVDIATHSGIAKIKQ